MDSGTTTQIRKKIDRYQFKKVLTQHKTFLLHLFNDDFHEFSLADSLVSLDLMEKRKEEWDIDIDPMETFLSSIEAPYFEIPMSSAVELMLEFGYSNNRIFKFENGKVTFLRALFVFHEGKLFSSTQDNCYCYDTIVENLLKINPDLVKVPD